MHPSVELSLWSAWHVLGRYRDQKKVVTPVAFGQANETAVWCAHQTNYLVELRARAHLAKVANSQQTL
jgi:hypothetical protein